MFCQILMENKCTEMKSIFCIPQSKAPLYNIVTTQDYHFDKQGRTDGFCATLLKSFNISLLQQFFFIQNWMFPRSYCPQVVIIYTL